MKSLYRDLWSRGSRVMSAHIFETHPVDLHVFNNFSEQKLFFRHAIARQRIELYPNIPFSYFPLLDQSKKFIYGNLDLNIQRRPEFLRFLLMELFRVGKQGCLMHYSPLYLSLVCASSKAFSARNPIVCLWTEEESNQLCIMPIIHGEEIDWDKFKKKYFSVVMSHPNSPLYFLNLYRWESFFEANLKFVYPGCIEHEESMIDHAIQSSLKHTHFINGNAQWSLKFQRLIDEDGMP